MNVRQLISHTSFACLAGALELATAQGATSAPNVLKLNRVIPTPPGIQTLQLKNRVGDVIFQGSSGRTIQIHALIRPSNNHGDYFFDFFSCCEQNFEKNVRSASIRINQGKGHVLMIVLHLPHDHSLKHVKVEWTIDAPEALSLKIRNNVGRIRIQDAGGTIIAHSDVGPVVIKDARASIWVYDNVGPISISGARRSILAHTNVGSIHVQSDLTSIRRIALDTNIGTLTLNGIPNAHGSGAATTRLLGGNYRYSGPGRYSIRLKVNIGKIDLSLPGSPQTGQKSP